MNDAIQPVVELSAEEFDYFRSKIFDLAGISMSPAKINLLQTRLRARVLALGFSNYEQYRKHLEGLPDDNSEWEIFVNLLTTNKTEWFREPKHFDFIVNKFLPHWKKLGKNHLNVWCAASSTGEEPYTLSLILNQALEGSNITYSIDASDIDTKVLGIAQNGVYPKSSLEQIPEEYHSHFSVGVQELSNWVKVKKTIKAPISFHWLNLIEYPYPLEKSYDLILCRNVLIYFNNETIAKVAENLFKQAANNSVLITAHSESLQNVKSSWKYLSPSIYLKGKIF